MSSLGGALGIAAGIWTLGASYLDGVARYCPAGGCPSSGVPYMGIVVQVLAVVLALNSAVSFFWQRRVLYASAILSILVALSVFLNSSATESAVVWVTVALALASAVVNILGAREGTGVSEQSHPMNLPVFG